MATERKFSSETESAFNAWLQKRGIQAVLFDGDDTIFDTQPLFARQIKKFLEFCHASSSHLDLSNLQNDFKTVGDSTFDMMGASPKQWKHVINVLCEKYGTQKFQEGLSLIEEIYIQSPEVLEGALDTLLACREAGLKVGMVTHASREWTDHKLQKLGFNFDTVLAIDVEVHKHKSAIHWQEAIDSSGVNPSKVMVVGDNINGDINAAKSVGVQTLVWIPSKWSKFGEGTLPDDVIKIDKIGNMIETLIGKNKG